jgi:hypothetical protein
MWGRDKPPLSHTFAKPLCPAVKAGGVAIGVSISGMMGSDGIECCFLMIVD